MTGKFPAAAYTAPIVAVRQRYNKPVRTRHSLIERAAGEDIDVGRIVRRHAVPRAGKRARTLPYRRSPSKRFSHRPGQPSLTSEASRSGAGRANRTLRDSGDCARRARSRVCRLPEASRRYTRSGRENSAEAKLSARYGRDCARTNRGSREARGPDAAFGRDRHAVGVIGVRGERKTGAYVKSSSSSLPAG